MYFINPFKGLRPTKEDASSVAITSTDHLSKDIVSTHKKNNPWSYLNVFGAQDSSKSKEQFELMKKKSVINKDSTSSFYIYKISTGDHEQIGIIGAAKLSAYDNLHIRGHEEIFLERAQKRLKQMDNLNAQIGPIYVIHPDNDELNELTKKDFKIFHEINEGKDGKLDCYKGYDHKSTLFEILSWRYDALNKTYHRWNINIPSRFLDTKYEIKSINMAKDSERCNT